MKVMLVEDDIHLATTIIEYLDYEGIVSDYCNDGLTALNLLEKEEFHVIVLDLNLPRMNGIEVCKTLREGGLDTPIIMLTAKDQLKDRLLGFEVGADDYLIKPFAIEELVARLKALSGRKSSQSRLIEIGCLKLNINNKSIEANGENLVLSPIGYKLLSTLMKSSPNAVSKRDLIAATWQNEEVELNNLKVQIHKLRKELNRFLSYTQIETVGKYGYVLRDNCED